MWRFSKLGTSPGGRLQFGAPLKPSKAFPILTQAQAGSGLRLVPGLLEPEKEVGVNLRKQTGRRNQ